jgi:hypothetical protein
MRSHAEDATDLRATVVPEDPAVGNDPGDLYARGAGVSAKPVQVIDLFEALLESLRPKTLPPSDLAVDAVVSRGEARGRESVDALEDEHGSLYVIGLLHSDHDWAEDESARRFHLRASVPDADAETYYEAFRVGAVTRAREIEGRWESLREAAAERACER